MSRWGHCRVLSTIENLGLDFFIVNLLLIIHKKPCCYSVHRPVCSGCRLTAFKRIRIIECMDTAPRPPGPGALPSPEMVILECLLGHFPNALLALPEPSQPTALFFLRNCFGLFGTMGKNCVVSACSLTEILS